MHNRTPLRAAPLAAFVLPLALLAACKKTAVESGPADPDANTIAAAPPVKLPPALMASRTYRCKDNSLIYIDFFDDKTTADFKTKKDGEPTKLMAPAEGQPYEGGGHKVSGNGEQVTIDGQSCKA